MLTLSPIFTFTLLHKLNRINQNECNMIQQKRRQKRRGKKVSSYGYIWDHMKMTELPNKRKGYRLEVQKPSYSTLYTQIHLYSNITQKRWRERERGQQKKYI